MIYINPKKNFSQEWFKNGQFLWKDETEVLLKIQIENSLEMGWKPEDIMLVMNFPYEYMGVKAIEVGDENYCEFSPTASKINVIHTLFEKDMIGDDLYWFHDYDAFQLASLDVNVENEIAITDYGIVRGDPTCGKRWSTGVIFFRKAAKDVFAMIRHAVNDSYKKNEEIALLAMTRCNYGHINDRIKKINITYNLATRGRKVMETYAIADKPLRVIHFHPFDPRKVIGNKSNKEIVPMFITESLKEVFNKYKIL